MCALVAIVVWVAAQRDAFDPDRRDLPLELLEGERPVIELYDRPLKPWVEPGTVVAGAAPALNLGMFLPAVVDTDWQPIGTGLMDTLAQWREVGLDELVEQRLFGPAASVVRARVYWRVGERARSGGGHDVRTTLAA